MNCSGQSYSAYQKYGSPGNITPEDLQRMFNEAQYTWWGQEQAKAEEERIRKKAEEERMREARERAKRENENFWRNFHGTDQDDESYTFRQHYTDQQSRSNSNGTYTHTFTPGISKDLQDAFKLLELPPVATVQEVKRKFRVLAKQKHPDTGGSEKEFIKLNNAYEKALAHAQRNEVK